MLGLKETIATLGRRAKSPMGLAAVDSGVLATVEGFGKNPGELVMRTYVPATHAVGRPLIVVLHGCTQNAEAYAVQAGWVELAEQYGFGLLCAEQVATNNANRCFNWFSPTDVTRGSGEVASIREMIDAAVQRMASDPSQIYVTGLSAGGAMTAAMLATYPEMFAGGGIIAGLAYGVAKDMPGAFAVMRQGPTQSDVDLGQKVRSASRHEGPWPRVAVWHGAADNTVAASNSDASAAQWVAANGLEADAMRVRIDGKGRRDQWVRDDIVVVERRIVTGLGHGTPISSGDGAGRAGPFILDVGISSSRELLQFWGVTASGQTTSVSEDDASRLPRPARPTRREEPVLDQGSPSRRNQRRH